MPFVSEILARKGAQVVSIGKQATVHEAAVLMNQHKIGALVVIDGERVEGIFTERDVLQRVVAPRKDPSSTKVIDVMTREIAVCQPDTSIEEARGVMKTRRIRHLPVIGPNASLVGLISLGDLNAFDFDHQEQTIHFLHQYLYEQTR